MAVQADPMAAVIALFATNPSCATCLVPCGSAADAVSCAMGCLKQARCPDATISPVGIGPIACFTWASCHLRKHVCSQTYELVLYR